MFFLLLITLSLYLLDDTKLKKVIGYEKVKVYMKNEINIFGIAKGFFGNRMFDFYNLDIPVVNEVNYIEKYGDGFIVFQENDVLYSTYIGSVICIEKNGDLYNVIIAKSNGTIKYYNLKEIMVSLYQKIELNTAIAYIDRYYYYEEN